LSRQIKAELNQGPGIMTTTSLSSDVTTKRQLLKELNQEFFPARTALNQAAIALDHASKALDASYQRKRARILNGHHDDD
jgi:hypothetical protein